MWEIESEIAAGRHAIACRNLDKLLSWKADPNGRIAYLLGSCELARGRHEAADAAWARVAPGSQFSEQAIEKRMHLFQESGQLAAAERLVSDAAGDPRNDQTALLVLLVPVFRELGRIDEADLVGKKTKIDRLRARYLKLHDRTQPIRDAEDLARLAEQLGGRFEARVFLTMAISEDPAREDLRLDLERLSASQAMPLVVSRLRKGGKSRNEIGMNA
jgi:tetratricopeptide (TPR) repeat protein